MRTTSCFCAVFFLSCCGAASGQWAASNVSLHKHMPLNAFGAQHTSANDCWGYVSPSGREYAIAGLSNGVAFVEITDPDHPVIVAQVPHTASLWGSIRTFGKYCYVGNEAGGGVQVIDLGAIDTGVVSLVRSITAEGLQTTHTIHVDATSGFMYLSGSNVIPQRGLAIYSLANPSDPARVGKFDAHYVHESQVVTYDSGPYAGRQIAFCFGGTSGLDVVDVTTKSNSLPSMAHLNYPLLGYCHQGWLSADRSLLYIDDEFDEAYGYTPTTRTIVVNVASLASPVYVGSFTTGEQSIDHNQYVNGRFLFQSNYTSGVHVWDLTNPVSPLRVGYFDTYPPEHPWWSQHGGGSFIYDGTWTNYPYFPSGTWIATDISYGLFILDPYDALHCLDADANHDSFVNGNDFDLYVGWFELGDDRADFNGDGFNTGDDFDGFIAAFERGC